MAWRTRLIETHQDLNNLYVIVPDRYAGRSRRYTLHRISLTGFKETAILGRELPLLDCRRIIRSQSV